MNLGVSDPALIGLDWGTSSLRAFLISADGEVKDSVSMPKGIMQVEDRDFEAVFDHVVDPWWQAVSIPVIASGMITSRNGWVETPYVPVPAGANELAGRVVRHETRRGRAVHFVTGLRSDHNGAPDVMRGEEVQIVGAVASGLCDGVFVLPGTHSKWVRVAGGRIEDHATCMTGEVFEALCAHTILGRMMEPGPFHPAGFGLGVTAGFKTGANLLHDLFHVRTLPLFDAISSEMTSDYLSGLLIGAEIASVMAAAPDTNRVTIVGRGDLSQRYEIALASKGLASQRVADDIAAHGLFLVARSAGLLS